MKAKALTTTQARELMTPHALCNYAPVPEAGCWIWLRSVLTGRYPTVRKGGANVRVNRLFYAYHKGDIPEGMHVCHKCDTPQCVNPDHLFLGTNGDNMADRKHKGRYMGEWNGRAKLTADQVREIRCLGEAGWSLRALSRKFGVSRTTVSQIHSRRYWSHIA